MLWRTAAAEVLLCVCPCPSVSVLLLRFRQAPDDGWRHEGHDGRIRRHGEWGRVSVFVYNVTRVCVSLFRSPKLFNDNCCPPLLHTNPAAAACHQGMGMSPMMMGMGMPGVCVAVWWAVRGRGVAQG